MIIAIAGGEGAQKLAEISANHYSLNPILFASENYKNSETRFISLGEGICNKGRRLVIAGLHSCGGIGRFAFGHKPNLEKNIA